MQQVSKRESYTVSAKLDPLSRDRIKWIKAALAHVMPDVREPSASLIMRRALENYVNYLGQILTPVARFQAVSGEKAHLLVAGQSNSVHWDGEFPAERVVDSDGNLVTFDRMEREARLEKNRRGIDDLIHGRKTRKGV